MWLLQVLKSWQRDASVLWNFLQPSPNMCQRDVVSFMVLWLKQEEYIWAKENTPASTSVIYIIGLPDNLRCDRRKWGKKILCSSHGSHRNKDHDDSKPISWKTIWKLIVVKAVFWGTGQLWRSSEPLPICVFGFFSFVNLVIVWSSLQQQQSQSKGN